MATSYEEISSGLSKLLDELVFSPKYPIRDLTEGKIKRVFGENDVPIKGVFLISNHNENNKPLYVGRSKTLAQRIGVDLRAITKEQATISYKLTTLKEKFPFLENIRDARQYMYDNYSVQMLRIVDENERAIFQIYAAMELKTINEFNSFIER